MKPTFNTITGGGIKVASFKVDTLGYFARCMKDLKLVTGVLSLPTEQHIKEISLKETKMGFVESPFWASAGSGIVTAMEKAAEILRKHDGTAGGVIFPDVFNNAAASSRMLKTIFVTDSGASFYKNYIIGITKTKLDLDVRAFVEDSPRFFREEVWRASDYYAALRSALEKLSQSISLW